MGNGFGTGLVRFVLAYQPMHPGFFVFLKAVVEVGVRNEPGNLGFVFLCNEVGVTNEPENPGFVFVQL